MVMWHVRADEYLPSVEAGSEYIKKGQVRLSPMAYFLHRDLCRVP